MLLQPINTERFIEDLAEKGATFELSQDEGGRVLDFLDGEEYKLLYTYDTYATEQFEFEYYGRYELLLAVKQYGGYTAFFIKEGDLADIITDAEVDTLNTFEIEGETVQIMTTFAGAEASTSQGFLMAVDEDTTVDDLREAVKKEQARNRGEA